MCHDLNNNPACNHDGGDCCLLGEDKNLLCTFCACHEESQVVEMVTIPIPILCPWYLYSAIGDGICDDFTNNYYCGYDGGDCCLEYSIKAICIECACYDIGMDIQNTGSQVYTDLFTKLSKIQ